MKNPEPIGTMVFRDIQPPFIWAEHLYKQVIVDNGTTMIKYLHGENGNKYVCTIYPVENPVQYYKVIPGGAGGKDDYIKVDIVNIRFNFEEVGDVAPRNKD